MRVKGTSEVTVPGYLHKLSSLRTDIAQVSRISHHAMKRLLGKNERCKGKHQVFTAICRPAQGPEEEDPKKKFFQKFLDDNPDADEFVDSTVYGTECGNTFNAPLRNQFYLDDDSGREAHPR